MFYNLSIICYCGFLCIIRIKDWIKIRGKLYLIVFNFFGVICVNLYKLKLISNFGNLDRIIIIWFGWY